jgi:hypothetical protein
MKIGHLREEFRGMYVVVVGFHQLNNSGLQEMFPIPGAIISGWIMQKNTPCHGAQKIRRHPDLQTYRARG